MRVSTMAVAAVVCFAACEGQVVGPSGVQGSGSLASALREASRASGVPAELLAARGWQATRFRGGHDDDGHSEGLKGRMGMSAEMFERAAALAGATPEELEADPAKELLGYALLVRDTSATQDWRGWATAAIAASGAPAEGPVTEAARDELLLLLADGLEVQTDEERVSVKAVELGFEVLRSTSQALTLPAPGQYPQMDWFAANPNNYVAGRPGPIKYVIVHDIEGSFWSAVSWFQQANPFRSSTHYVIRSSDGYIVQMVGEANTAWHAGNDHFSRYSIGIEHEGFASAPDTWFTEAMYQSSARLVCAIAKKHNIPVDSQHIIGHFQIPNPNALPSSSPAGTYAQTQATPFNYGGISNHFDPGKGASGWKWDYYLGLVRTCVDAANGVSPGSGQIACEGPRCFATATLELGNDSKPIYLLKQNLVLLGYLTPAAAKATPTRFDQATKDAVAALQGATAIGVTSGIYGIRTAEALRIAMLARSFANVPSTDVSFGQTSANVTTLQNALTRLGFSVPATGFYGSLTRQAVLDFQTRQRVPGGDGTVAGSMTRMALAAALARGL